MAVRKRKRRPVPRGTPKDTDRRLTPPDVICAAHAVAGGRLALDVATEPENPVGALRYVSLPADGLALDWDHELEAVGELIDRVAVGWCNPPFSAPAEWFRRVARARGSWLAFSAVDFSTAWWEDLEWGCVARCELHDRPRCDDPSTGTRKDIARCGVVWLRSSDPEVIARFVEHFGELGSIVWLTPDGAPGSAPSVRAATLSLGAALVRAARRSLVRLVVQARAIEAQQTHRVLLVVDKQRALRKRRARSDVTAVAGELEARQPHGKHE